LVATGSKHGLGVALISELLICDQRRQDVAIAKPAVAINRERRMIGNLVIELEQDAALDATCAIGKRLIGRVPLSAKPIMASAPISMQIMINWLCDRSLDNSARRAQSRSFLRPWMMKALTQIASHQR
jgi:hypothetical protein